MNEQLPIVNPVALPAPLVGDGRKRLITALIAAVLALAVFLPIAYHEIYRIRSDYYYHVLFTQQMADGTMAILPHPLLHLFLWTTHLILPIDLTAAMMLVTMVLYMSIAAVIVLAYLLPALNGEINIGTAAVVIGLALTLMLVAPINVSKPGDSNYFGYLMPNVYHNPTIIALKPFALLLFLYLVGIFSDQPYFRTRGALITGVLVLVLASTAKPNYTLAALPALGVFTGYALARKQPVNWKLLIALVGVLVVILGIQYLMHPPSKGHIEFYPFAFLRWVGGNNRRLLKFGVSILFPLVTYLVYLRKTARDNTLNLAWLIFAFGAFYFYMLVESDGIAEGNFIWSGQITLFVLFVASAAFLLRQIYTPGKGFKLNWASAICLLALGVNLAGGLIWYIGEFTKMNMWW
jgi:hypothetical protein